MYKKYANVRCYKCGLVEFIIPVGADPTAVICEYCRAKIEMQRNKKFENSLERARNENGI
jgi:hypothetical protein